MSLKTVLTAASFATATITGATTAAHANDAARFTLANASGQNIDLIQVSPVSSDRWGRDLLGDRVLEDGYQVVVNPSSTGCMFDVRVTYRNDDRESFRDINLCRVGKIRFANTQDYTMN